MIEGGVDATVFSNFMYTLLKNIREDPERCRRQVVVFMDNARIHGTPMVLQVTADMKAMVLMNAQYSPSLNPVEQFFGSLKQTVKKRDPNGR